MNVLISNLGFCRSKIAIFFMVPMESHGKTTSKTPLKRGPCPSKKIVVIYL